MIAFKTEPLNDAISELNSYKYGQHIKHRDNTPVPRSLEERLRQRIAELEAEVLRLRLPERKKL